LAAKKGHLDICELILKNVVDKNPQNNAGKTPLTLASENDHINVCSLICQYLSKNENKNEDTNENNNVNNNENKN
jgi:ankyrin repeat protein